MLVMRREQIKQMGGKEPFVVDYSLDKFNYTNAQEHYEIIKKHLNMLNLTL
jgi:hypothetical protein